MRLQKTFLFSQGYQTSLILKVAQQQFRESSVNNKGEKSGALQMRFIVEWDSHSTAISTEPL